MEKDLFEEITAPEPEAVPVCCSSHYVADEEEGDEE